jgi:hypothetical protein
VRHLARLAFVGAIVSLAEAASQHESARGFLSGTFNLSRAEIGRIDAGQVVSRTLETNHAREVATLGIIRVATTPEKYVERLADIATFKRTDEKIREKLAHARSLIERRS